MTRRDTFRGTSRFTLEPAWRLVAPRSGPPPWPLLVALHGMGQSGDVIHPLVAPITPEPMALLVPDGPLPVEVRDGDRRRIGSAWYVYDGDRDRFIESARRTDRYLGRLIDRVAREHPVDRRRIFLLGHSQGGYMAGLSTMFHPGRYRGLVAVACRIEAEIVAGRTPRGPLPDVLVLHGERDRFIPVAKAKASARALVPLGFEVTIRTDPGGHRLTPERLAPAADWLAHRITTGR